MEDSLVVIAASKTPPLNLGNDLQICPGNIRILHAGHQFMNYEWQDGTTDSLLSINQPGQYWVKVTDSCNNVISDTINISIAPPVPLSIGADRVICIKDTVRLSATPGFINYQWSPSYQASSTTGQSIIVNPLTDTLYTVIGEKSPGCFAYDTVRITVHSSPPINLGKDTSFCRGDSLVLGGVNGFITYTWSTGASNQQITVKNAGTYSVTGTTIFGCKSYDTIAVLNVFNLPSPQLDKNATICEGVPKQLNAGSGFIQYNWSTGDLTPTITVNAAGSYSVEVTDLNGCKGADTARITTVQPSPALFLPGDISICDFETATLTPLKTFNNYLWNNGDITPAITTGKPGIYWLQVTDPFGCIGKDSISVLLKKQLH